MNHKLKNFFVVLIIFIIIKIMEEIDKESLPLVRLPKKKL